jgi:hypothetical protein
MLHLTQLPRIHHSDNSNEQCAISGFCQEADQNCALLGNFIASGGNSLPLIWTTYQYHFPASKVRN